MSGRIITPLLAFTPEDLERAWSDWGCNCGPTSLAVMLSLGLDEVHAAIPRFDERHYTNPTMMLAALKTLGANFRHTSSRNAPVEWPSRGLARIQWAGPWTHPGVPIPARYRHSHWVATMMADGIATLRGKLGRGIFDVNCPHWISFEDWSETLVPAILKECEPKASGEWWITNAIEIGGRNG